MDLKLMLATLMLVGVSSRHSEALSTASPTLATTLKVSDSKKSNETNRRDGISYTTSVIHRDPKFPDANAESSIDFHLNVENSNSHSNSKAKKQRPSSPAVRSQHEMKSLSGAVHQQQQKAIKQEVQDGNQSSNDNTKVLENYYQQQDAYYKPLINEGQFAQPTFTETKHNHKVEMPQLYGKSNVRTFNRGYRTQKPTTKLEPQKFLHMYHHQQQQQQQQQHKQQEKKPKALIFQTPNEQTQSFNVGYSVKFGNDKEKDKVRTYVAHKNVDSDIITGSHKEEVYKPAAMNGKYQNHKQHYYELPQGAQSWKNVEVIKSKEIPVKLTNFDHDKAIGKSEGFDYTNAVSDFLSQNKESLPVFAALRQEKPTEATYNAAYKIPKIPIDTTLLRQPYAASLVGLKAEEKPEPLKFDATTIEEMSEIANFYSQQFKDSSFPKYEDFQQQQQQQPQYASLVVQPTQQSPNYFPQSPVANIDIPVALKSTAFKDPQKVSELVSTAFGYPQNGLFNLNTVQKTVSTAEPILKQPYKMYKVKENLQDAGPPPTHPSKFKVFGKPNNFMRHQYEKSRHVHHENPYRIIRTNVPSSKRIVREYATNIEMDLRPPPMHYTKLIRLQ